VLPGLQLVVPLVHGPFIYISKVVACYAGLDCKSQMVAAICRRQRLNSGEAKWLEMKTWELEGHLIQKSKVRKINTVMESATS